VKKTKILLFLSSLFVFANCEESQNYKPLRSINGEWRITRFRYTDYQSQKDSTTIPQNATLIFNLCTKQENKQPSNCKMTYQGGGVSLPFTFQVTDNDRLAINGDTYRGSLQREFRQAERVLNGGYQILRLDDNLLRITGDKDCTVNAGQASTCRYRVEIEAVRQ
jgi:hypothetical protein